jgi:hypothetical protein
MATRHVRLLPVLAGKTFVKKIWVWKKNIEIGLPHLPALRAD